MTAFVRGTSEAPPPFPAPRQDDVLFCSGWFPADELRRQISDSHAGVWIYGGGIASLFLGSPEPMTVRISVDGRPHSTQHVAKLLPDRATRVGLPGARWHLITLDSGPLPEIRGRPRGVRIIAVLTRT